MSQAPYMPLFTDALLGDTLHLSAEEFGAYCMILFATWSNNGQPLPDDDVELARVCRVTRQKWFSIRRKINSFFSIDDGFWRQKRLEKEWAYVQQRIETNRKNGAKGGRRKAAPRNPPLDQKASDGGSDGGSTYTYTQKERKNPPPHPTESNPAPARTRNRRSSGDEREDDVDFSGEFEEFWQAYPRKVNRKRAFSAFVVARKTESFEQLLAAARRYAAENSGKLLLHVARPENWLADQRWLDDPETARAPTDGRTETGPAYPVGSLDHWRDRVRMWFDEQHGGPTRENWLSTWGPAPGEPGCLCPLEVLAEFGWSGETS